MERTEYMHRIIIETYHHVATEAILAGFNECWERVIAKRLKADYDKGVSEAEVILEYIGGTSPEDLLKAAYLVINSKPKQHG